MKIMSYNCFEGAASTRDTLFEIIEHESPDVLQLQEINGWGEGSPNTLENLAAQAGFQGIAYGDSNTRFKLGTLTRQPMINAEVLREGFWHCAVHTAIPFGKDDQLQLWNVHLNPRFEDDRLPEVEQIIDQIDPDSYAVITGDLNSLARDHAYPGDLVSALTAQGLHKFGTGRLRHEVTGALLNAGFVDVGAHYPWQSTVPTPANKDAAHAAELRLDYAFTTPKLARLVTSYQVLKDESTDRASDHYPICIVL